MGEIDKSLKIVRSGLDISTEKPITWLEILFHGSVGGGGGVKEENK